MAFVEVFANDAAAGVSSGGADAPSAGTQETWTLTSSTLPAVSSASGTHCYVCDPLAESEKMLITNISGSTATVVRGASGTTPVAHAPGFTIQQILTSATLQSLQQVLQPSGDTTGATDAAAINAAIASLPSSDGGVVILAPTGDWNIACGQVSATTGVYISAAGCWVNARGTGDVFRFVDTSTYSSRDLRGGGILGFPVIDGTHTTGNSSAVHAGDILQLSMFVQAQNFTAGTTSKGIWFDNQNYWTEQLYGRVFAQNCTQHVVFDVSGTPAVTATGSYDRTDLNVYIAQVSTSNDGVVFQNGTYIIDGALAIRGNFNGAASNPSTAVLRLTGSAGGSRPDSGQYSRLVACTLIIATECNTSIGFTDGPHTVYLNSSSNTISDCSGLLDFSAAGNYFQPSNATSANFSYFGNIAGDSVLAAIPQTPTNPQLMTQLLTLENSGNALVASTDGTTTSGGAIVLSPQSDTHGFIGIYSTSLSQYAYLVPNVINAHWAPSVGGVNGTGMGVLGSTHGTTAPCFTVLNFSQAGFGLGNSGFTIYDNDLVVTYRNTLDDGSGNMTLAGNLGLAAGGTSLAPMTFRSGTLLTVAAAGVTEYDGTAFYLTAASSSRQLADAEQFTSLTTTYTLSSTTALQKLFNASSTGALTVQGATSYFFECEFDISGMATASGNFSFGFGGSATFTSLKYVAWAQKSNSLTTPATPQIVEGTTATAQALVSNTATTMTTGTGLVKGIFRVNASGTVIPEIATGVATSTAVIGANAFFRAWPCGNGSITSVGNWS